MQSQFKQNLHHQNYNWNSCVLHMSHRTSTCMVLWRNCSTDFIFQQT